MIRPALGFPYELQDLIAIAAAEIRERVTSRLGAIGLMTPHPYGRYLTVVLNPEAKSPLDSASLARDQIEIVHADDIRETVT